jgi:hypothetical protein
LCHDARRSGIPATLPLRIEDHVRKRLGRGVVDWVARVPHDRLPRQVLEAEVPDPKTVLASFVLDDRTRNVLERSWPFGRPGYQPGSHREPWTVSRYLEMPRFGPHCMVDLLAARAEAAGDDPAARPPPGVTTGVLSTKRSDPKLPVCPTWLPIEEVSAFLLQSLPLSGDEIGQHFLREGIAQRPISLTELARAYRIAGEVPPFRSVRCGATEIAVPASMHGIAHAIAATARRFVSWWGLAAVQSVETRARVRVQALRSFQDPVGFPRRMLASCQGLVWLDDAKEWFSFRDSSSPLSDAVKKAFTVSNWVEVAQLRSVVVKLQPRLAQLPACAIERYLSEIVGCRIAGPWCSLLQPSSIPPATGPERELVDFLNRAGGKLSVVVLKGRVERSGISQIILRRLLKSSPLFVVSRGGFVQLVGHPDFERRMRESSATYREPGATLVTQPLFATV